MLRSKTSRCDNDRRGVTTGVCVWGLTLKGSYRSSIGLCSSDRTATVTRVEEWEAVLWEAMALIKHVNNKNKNSDGNSTSSVFSSSSVFAFLDINFDAKWSLNPHCTSSGMCRRLFGSGGGGGSGGIPQGGGDVVVGDDGSSLPPPRDLLVPSLSVFRLANSTFDESQDLALLTGLEHQLREIAFKNVALTTLNNLLLLPPPLQRQHQPEPHAALHLAASPRMYASFDHLKKLVLFHCKQLLSLDGLCAGLVDVGGDANATTTSMRFAALEEVDASHSGIRSIRGLRCCRALRRVIVLSCHSLTSLDGLQHMPLLTEVNASSTAVGSAFGLQGCQSLQKAIFFDCQQLTSLEGLGGLLKLEEVYGGSTSLASLSGLRGCYAMRKIFVHECKQLTSLSGVEGMTSLEILNASYSAIGAPLAPAAATATSTNAPSSSCPPPLQCLQGCKGLQKLDLCTCRQLKTLKGLEGLEHFEEVNVGRTAIASLAPLFTGCSGSGGGSDTDSGTTQQKGSLGTLRKLDISDCDKLPAKILALPPTRGIGRGGARSVVLSREHILAAAGIVLGGGRGGPVRGAAAGVGGFRAGGGGGRGDGRAGGRGRVAARAGATRRSHTVSPPPISRSKDQCHCKT